MSDTDNTSGSSSSGSTSGTAQRETTAVDPADTPDTGRPVPPDIAGGDGSIHRPGHAPGMSVLDGPAIMTVGAHRKKNNKSGGKK